MRWIPLIPLAVGLTLVPSPAGAKGPAMTFDIVPPAPVVGQPASLLLRTWEWTRERPPRPDRSRPSDFFGSEPPVLPALFISHAPNGETPAWIIRPRFDRFAFGVYRARLLFPADGVWVVGWESFDGPDPIEVAFSVEPEASAGATSSTVASTAMVDDVSPAVLALCAVTAALLALVLRIRASAKNERR